MIYAAAFSASLVYVFLRAFQQQTVIQGRYWLVAPVSMAMGWCDVYLIFHIAKTGGWIWLATGTGGAIGCMTAMYLHRRFIDGRKRTARSSEASAWRSGC
jgi:hypothetical protein